MSTRTSKHLRQRSTKSFRLAQWISGPLLIGCLALAWTLPALAETRIALVIGNSDYQHVTKLANPRNDARLIANALRSVGFTLIGDGPLLDQSKREIEQAIRALGQHLTRDSVSVFYYAGHGIQIGGTNYIAPVEANVASVTDAKYELVDTNFVLDEMSAASSRLNIVILDACRNNPFAGSALRGIERGLAQITAPAGTIVGYSTQPGNVALDGAGTNSPYAAALAHNIIAPGPKVLEVLNNTGLEVKNVTAGRQQPWLALSPLEGDFAFAAPVAAGRPSSPRTNTALAELRDPPTGGSSGQFAKDAVTRPSATAASQPPEAPAARPGSPATGASAVALNAVTLDVCPNNYEGFTVEAPPLICSCSAAAIKEGTPRGANPYHWSSPICRAAVHAGIIGPQGGTVVVTPDKADAFPSVTRNDIVSLAYRRDVGFRLAAVAGAAPLAPADLPAASGGMTLDVCPNNYEGFAADASALSCGCSAAAVKEGTPRGANPYHWLSPICRAAVHAGIIGPQGGTVVVTPERADVFPGVTRNGVVSLSYRGDAGFRVSTVAGQVPVSPVQLPAATSGMILDVCPNNYEGFAADAPALTCSCSAAAVKEGTPRGANPYHWLSPICRAAVHAGVIGPQGGTVVVTPEKADVFPGVTRNDIVSLAYRRDAGFRVARPPASTRQ